MRMYQLAMDHSLVNCGMSYVFELEDQSFFLIDGGYFTPGEDERLYALLQKLVEGRPIHISGWFFSHAHQDHIGCFINFIRRYAGDVMIDALYYNFQPCDFSSVGDADWRSSDPATFREFYIACDEALPTVRRHILQTGDTVTLPGLSFEVLYTWPDMAPAKSTFNDHTTVIMVHVKGQKLLFLGDIYTEGSRCLLRAPERLRCDVVQVAHHGFRGADVAVYESTRAQTALWPVALSEVAPNAFRDANHYLLYDSGMEILFAEDDACLRFPYAPGEAVITRRNSL